MFWLAYLLFVAAFSLFCWYISPFRQAPASKGQMFFARLWLLFRRLVCCVAAIIFLLALIPVMQSDMAVLSKIGAVAFIVLMAVFVVYVGIVGQGWNRYSFKDDIALYQAVKKKYKWK